MAAVRTLEVVLQMYNPESVSNKISLRTVQLYQTHRLSNIEGSSIVKTRIVLDLRARSEVLPYVPLDTVFSTHCA